MKKFEERKTAYRRIALGVVGACTLGLLAFPGVSNAGVQKEANNAAITAGVDVVSRAFSDRAKETLSQEDYEKLVAEDYKKSGGMVRFGNYRKRFEVRKTTMFIGTYLIEFDGLNETYYRSANLSKSQHNQNIAYYKSEIFKEDALGDGETADDVWVTLNDANLSKLSTGPQTRESGLDEYWISAVVTSEGVFDPMTGEEKDLTDPYDLMALPELKPLKDKYDEIENTPGRTEEQTLHNYYTRNLIISTDADADRADADTFATYSGHGRNEITNKCDVEINALKAYYKKIKPDENGEENEKERAAVVLDLYTRLDAKRRVEVYKFLSVDVEDRTAALNKLEQMLRARAMDETKSFTADEDYIAAAQQSLANCKETYQQCLTMQMLPGTTVLSEYRYRQCERLIDVAYENKLDEDGETILNLILAANHIGAEKVVDQNVECTVLTTALVPDCTSRYEEKVIAPVTKEYIAAERDEKSDEVKKEIVTAQYDDAVKQMQELEFLIQATTTRMDTEQAAALIQEHIVLCDLWKTMVFDDPYGPLAGHCIQLYRDWLLKLYKSVTGEDYDDGSGSDEDEIDYDALRQRAEEEDDPEALRMLDVLEGQNKNVEETEGGNTNVTDLSMFLNGISSLDNKGLLDLLAGMVKKDVSNGNYGSLESFARAAGDSGYDMSDFLNGLDDTAKDLADKAYRDGADRDSDRNGENYNDGNGADVNLKDYDLDTGDQLGKGDLTDEQLANLIKDLFGAAFEDLSPDIQGAIVVAFNRYGKAHNATNVLAYARMLLSKMIADKNPLVYAQYEADQTAEYISLGAVDYSRAYTNYRYVIYDGVDTLTGVMGGGSFSFAGNRATDGNGEPTDLKREVGYQVDDYIKAGTRYAYVCEADSLKLIMESAEYIVDTDWGVLVTQDMEDIVAKIMELLAEMAGV